MTRAPIALALLLATAPAMAQTPLPQQQAPNMPAPNTTIPEKVEPEAPATTGSTSGGGATLSDKLQATDGVIRPPENIAPDMRTPAPVPNPGTTPVIPPPGSPGGNLSVDPK